MPGNPHECRDHAKNCLRLAAEAASPAAKERFQVLARCRSGGHACADEGTGPGRQKMSIPPLKDTRREASN